MADAFIVPLCVKVAPEGIVMVSPEAPSVMSVPVLGSIVFTFTLLIYTITKVDPEGIVTFHENETVPAIRPFLLAFIVRVL